MSKMFNYEFDVHIKINMRCIPEALRLFRRDIYYFVLL